jgi:8-amino-7-oxononanoate synthase
MRRRPDAPGVPTDLIAGLLADLAVREADGRKRTRRTVASAQGPRVVVDGRELVSFASNDYLGLAGHPDVVAAARDGALRWGIGAGASHVVCGHSAAHAALEAELAAFARPCPGAQALTFSSGYLANLAILTALARGGDAIFADRLNHACLNDGAALSRAEFVRYSHGDVAALERRVAASTARRKLIATDAVFSMDGDLAPLPALGALAEAFDAWLVVDDAHGFGVLGAGEDRGRGALAHFGLASERIVYMGTLGKAAGVAGAFVAAHPAVIATLVETARPYMFTTAAPSLLAEALRASLRIIRDDAARHARLAARIAHFRARMRGLPWRLLESPTAIQPVVVGPNAAAVDLAGALWQRGFWVPAIRPPTVPRGTARLRIALTAAHSQEDVDALVDVLAELAPGAASADPR